jgi:hypothetical protein
VQIKEEGRTGKGERNREQKRKKSDEFREGEKRQEKVDGDW